LGLASLHVCLPSPATAALLAAAAPAAGPSHRLARLTSLSLTAPPCGPASAWPISLRLDALGALTCLTALELSAPVDDASEGWLPPCLKRLALGPGEAPPAGAGAGQSCGPAWLRAAPGCAGLESLELRHLSAGDVGAEDPAQLHATLLQVGWAGSGGSRDRGREEGRQASSRECLAARPLCCANLERRARQAHRAMPSRAFRCGLHTLRCPLRRPPPRPQPSTPPLTPCKPLWHFLTRPQLTALTSLTGVLLSTAPNAVTPPLHGGLLLPGLPALRRLLVYRLSSEPGITKAPGELTPALEASWRQLAAAPAAGRLQDLAVCCHADFQPAREPPQPPPAAAPAGAASPAAAAAAAPRGVFPRLASLHATAYEPHAYPLDLALAFPALERAVFGDASSEAPVHLPPLRALARLPCLRRLSLAAGEWGACLPGGLGFDALARCALRELELYDLTLLREDADVTEAPAPLRLRHVLSAARSPPRLSRLVVAAPRGVMPGVAPARRREAAAALARRVAAEGVEGLLVVVRGAEPQPSLLEAAAGAAKAAVAVAVGCGSGTSSDGSLSDGSSGGSLSGSDSDAGPAPAAASA
jgi:hypothetical protein